MTTESKGFLWLAAGAVVLYCSLAALYIFQDPGLQYDEALLVEASVHMLNSPAELTLPHDPDTWICPAGSCLPLMTVRYIGPIKEYLCLPLFALLGAHTTIIRIVSTLLAALGIWGLATLVREHVSGRASLVVALILAINPTYLDLTVFDNDAVAPLMAALGLLCLAVSGYLHKRTAAAALWIGAAMGFGIWARANYLMVLVAIAAAVGVVLRRRLRAVPVSHWGAVIAGGLFGGAPFLAYQIHSHGGTWQGLGMFVSHETTGQRVLSRIVQISELLLSDREHRAIWAGPPMPGWQLWLWPAIVLTACCVCLLPERKSEAMRLFARISALSFLFLAAYLLLSKLELSEHHLVVLLPIAAVVVSLAGVKLAARYRVGVFGAALLATLYVGSALFWHASAMQGLATTGGVGVWSDGVNNLAASLERQYKDKEIKILDWGLQNNLYVLTEGRLHTRELWPDASFAHSGAGRPWMEEVQGGGIFLLNGPGNRQFPDASNGFLQAVADGQPVQHRSFFPQRDGKPYAEIIEIEPNTAHERRQTAGANETISMGDARSSKQLTGFHPIEDNGWRWTKREFSILFTSPVRAPGASLKVQLYFPDSLMQRLGSVQLRARVNGHALAPETYRQPGESLFQRDVEPGSGSAASTRIDFSLDKSLAASPSDERELGVIVKSASLEAK